MTDIKMPKMNGIDLSYRVKEINPDCSILIMSGYSEIDYLKSAIRLSALNFVENPLTSESWLNGLKNRLKSRIKSGRTRSILKTTAGS